MSETFRSIELSDGPKSPYDKSLEALLNLSQKYGLPFSHVPLTRETAESVNPLDIFNIFSTLANMVNHLADRLQREGDNVNRETLRDQIFFLANLAEEDYSFLPQTEQRTFSLRLEHMQEKVARLRQ